MADRYRLEIQLNGTHLCVAGMTEFGVLQATLEVEHDDSVECEQDGVSRSPNKIKCALDVVGMTQRDEPMQWKKVALNPGDEVTLRVLPSGKADAPEVFGFDDVYHDDVRNVGLGSAADPYRLELRLNGEVKCVAGMTVPGSLSATLAVDDWAVGRQPDGTPIQPDKPRCDVNVEGVTYFEEVWQWKQLALKPNDEVAIRVLPGGKADAPELYRYDVDEHHPGDWQPWDNNRGRPSAS